MENKSILSLKTRVSELEKQHNRLTTLVVSVMANCEKLKKRLLETEGSAVSSSVDKNIQNILNTESVDSDNRTEQLLEELKKAQMV
jgi:predicted component of type VI protein secretion system